MLKICHITTKHTAFDTRIFYKECLTLKNQYQVILLAANAPAEIIEGVEITGFVNVKNSHIRNLIRVLRIALKQKAIVYHIHDPDLLPLARLLNLCGKKIIYDVHENYRESFKEHRVPIIAQKIFHLLDQWASKHGHIILAERSYIPIYQGRARNMAVVENFCDIEALKPYCNQERGNCTNLVYIGTIHPHRGALVMLEVLYTLHQRGLHFTLDLVGKITDPGLLKQMEQLPYYHKIKDKINFHGQLNISESYQIAFTSFAGLCLIEEMPNHRESYPTKLFEYMAVGLPIIASDIVLYRAVVERRECGICVPYTDIMVIAEAIEKIYSDKKLLQKFSDNGPIAVKQNYNWAHEKNILLDFYNKIVSN